MRYDGLALEPCQVVGTLRQHSISAHIHSASESSQCWYRYSIQQNIRSAGREDGFALAQEIGGRAGFRWFGLTTRSCDSFPLSHWPSLPRKGKEGWPGRIAPARVGCDGGVDEARWLLTTCRTASTEAWKPVRGGSNRPRKQRGSPVVHGSPHVSSQPILVTRRDADHDSPSPHL